MGDVQFQYNKEYEGKSLAVFAKSGGKIHVPTAEQRATFTVSKAHMRKWFIDKYGAEWIEKAEKAVAAAEAEVSKERAVVLGR
jgi:hypothetical protein